MIWSGAAPAAGHFLCPSMRFSPPEWKVNALTNVLLSYHLFLISGDALYLCAHHRVIRLWLERQLRPQQYFIPDPVRFLYVSRCARRNCHRYQGG